MKLVWIAGWVRFKFLHIIATCIPVVQDVVFKPIHSATCILSTGAPATSIAHMVQPGLIGICPVGTPPVFLTYIKADWTRPCVSGINICLGGIRVKTIPGKWFALPTMRGIIFTFIENRLPVYAPGHKIFGRKIIAGVEIVVISKSDARWIIKWVS